MTPDRHCDKAPKATEFNLINFVFAAQLRTKYPAQKWVLGGVAMILDIGISI